MNALLEAALERARTGACVLPVWWTDAAGVCACPKGNGCASPGKHPLTVRGLDDASRDPSTIRRWWQRWPQANLAERTDDIVRIDVDLRDVADALAADIPLQAETEMVQTPRRGGLHIALRVTGPVAGCDLYLDDGRKLGELKAARGYVLRPPSRIAEGEYRRLSAEGVPPLEVDDPVAWLAGVLPGFGYGLDDKPPSRAYEALGGAVYEGEGRHNALVSYAGKVWVAGMAPETLAAVLQAVNEGQCRPPLPEHEVQAIADHFIAGREPRATHDPAIVSSATSRPQIRISGRHRRDIAADAWAAMTASNDPPRFFRHGRGIAELTRDDEGRLLIGHLSLPALAGHVDRCADFMKATDDGLRPARPPRDVVEDMDAMEKPLPVLRGIVGTPVFAADGTLVTETGYQAATRLYYEPDGDAVPPVPATPDATHLRMAKEIILLDWLGDFPFVDDASRANAIAIALTVIAREMIAGPTPLFAVDAPAAGTGKGLLASGVGMIVTGAEPPVMSELRSDDELRKRLTAKLSEGASVILFDNLRRRLDSGVLAAALTAPVWSDRVLGRSAIVDVPVRAVWICTGNNLQLSDEIARRCVWIRLDAKRDRPWEGRSFRHADLKGWLRLHRHELVWAFLVLVQHWVARGRPAWEGRPLGTFEEWSRVAGGVLAASGIAGFMENREALYQRTDAASEEWRRFSAAWWSERGPRPATVGDLLDLAQELLPSVFAKARDGASDRALRTRLGQALAEQRDRRFGDLFIRQTGVDGHSKSVLWALEQAAEDDVLADVAGGKGSTSAQHPQPNGPISGSFADVADVADVVSGYNAHFSPEGGEGPCAGGIAKQHPQVPQHPQTDSNAAPERADVVRMLAALDADVPQTHAPCEGGCGQPVPPGQKCSACAEAAVREWKEHQR